MTGYSILKHSSAFIIYALHRLVRLYPKDILANMKLNLFLDTHTKGALKIHQVTLEKMVR